MLKISCPGAPRCTECRPVFENTANASLRVVAATEITLGSGVFAGYVGRTSLSLNSLPEAAIKRIPAFCCAWIASVKAWEYSVPPQLLLLATML